jgi:hypothetical protein
MLAVLLTNIIPHRDGNVLSLSFWKGIMGVNEAFFMVVLYGG